MLAYCEPRGTEAEPPLAVVAIGHDLQKLAYFVMQRGTPYDTRESGSRP